MAKKTNKQPEQPSSALDEAVEVKSLVKQRLDNCDPSDMAKYVDAYARAANVVRQFEKDRKRALASFSDDEVSEYLRTLPDRRRDAILTAARGSDLAGKPLFLIRALFKGGTWDGQWHDVAHPTPHYVVAVPPKQTATIDDFRIINLDEVWNGRPMKYEKQVYKLSRMRNADGSFSHFVYELEVDR